MQRSRAALVGLLAVITALTAPASALDGGSRRRVASASASASAQAQAAGVHTMPLRNDWQHVLRDLEPLLASALGPEVAFWRQRRPTCADLVQTVKSLQDMQPDNARLVLIRNNSWHFLLPTHSAVVRASFNRSGRVREAWPSLEPEPPGQCQMCNSQLSALVDRVAGSLGRPMGPGGPHLNLPDMVLMLNAEDSNLRLGRDTRAPLLSIMKWWGQAEAPWWDTAANVSLGRVGGQAVSLAAAPPDGTAAPPEGGVEGAVARFLAAEHPLLGPGAAAGAAAGGGAALPYDPDILLPTMMQEPASLHFFPFNEAADKAFWAGAPACPAYPDAFGGGVCLRVYLAHLARDHAADLEVRLTHPYSGPLGSRRDFTDQVVFSAAHRASMAEHARYRYLLSMDGVTGSYQLPALMTLPSVILKSRSPFVEWFSRLQVPGAHYLEFWRDPEDPRDVLRALEEGRRAAAADPEAVKGVIEVNQQIAAKYLGPEPRLAYAQAALLVYRSLLPDMDSCVADLVNHLEDTGRRLVAPQGGWPLRPRANFIERRMRRRRAGS